MTAIPVHHTPVDTINSWDGPAEVAKAASEEKTLRYMHAWVDAAGDPNRKGSYKFPHHEAGTDTPANLAGVNNAMARISQANIPDGDRPDVEAHLQAHQDDADKASSEAKPRRKRNAPAPRINGESSEPRERAPIRVFQGNAQPHEAFWQLHDEADTGAEPEMEFNGVISEYSWFEDDVTPKKFKEDLYRLGNGGPITLRINSPGGDMIAASVMRSILTTYPGLITARVDGLCASAATIVALGANTVKMQDSSFFMIHDPQVVFFLAALNLEDLGRLLDELKSAKSSIVDVYESKTGMSRPRLAKMMQDETWLTAQDAVTLGFADEVLGVKTPSKAAAMSNAAFVNVLKTYSHVPPGLISAEESPALRSDRQQAVEREREAQRLREYVQIFQKGEQHA